MIATRPQSRQKRRNALRKNLAESETMQTLALFGGQRTLTRTKLKRFRNHVYNERALRNAGMIQAASFNQPTVLVASEAAAALADWLSEQALDTHEQTAAMLKRLREANFSSLRTEVLVQAYQNGGSLPDNFMIHEAGTIREAILGGLRRSGAIADRELTPLGMALGRWYCDDAGDID